MNSKDILEAMTDIDQQYILSAQKILAYDAKNLPAATHGKHNLRKIITHIAVILILVSLTITTVLAVSPAIRDKVFSFWKSTQPEIIPSQSNPTQGSTPNMEVFGDPITIGDSIEATYIHFPSSSHARNGVFLVCTDEVMMNSGNHYDAYCEENGEFVKLEEHHFSQDYQLLGHSIHVEFEWAEYKGNVNITYVDSDVPFRKQNLAGDVSATLFTLQLPLADGTGSTNYPVLINVETGELTDICAGTGVERIPDLYQAAISRDLTKLLLVDWNKTIYYVDLVSKHLYDLDKLSGEHVEECSLVGSTLVCWVLENDSIEEGKLGTYRAWAIDLNTMEQQELFTDFPATAATSHDVWSNAYDSVLNDDAKLPPLTCRGLHFIEGFNMTSHWGNMYLGSKFAIEVEEDRKVNVIDLADGTKHLIEGFIWPDMDYPYIECCPSPDGEKLLIQTYTTDGYYSSIGILDYEAKSYYTFSRENLGEKNEHTIYWFDNESIIVATSDAGNSRDYYLYRLKSVSE